jgi:hypothetical protein
MNKKRQRQINKEEEEEVEETKRKKSEYGLNKLSRSLFIDDENEQSKIMSETNIITQDNKDKYLDLETYLGCSGWCSIKLLINPGCSDRTSKWIIYLIEPQNLYVKFKACPSSLKAKILDVTEKIAAKKMIPFIISKFPKIHKQDLGYAYIVRILTRALLLHLSDKNCNQILDEWVDMMGKKNKEESKVKRQNILRQKVKIVDKKQATENESSVTQVTQISQSSHKKLKPEKMQVGDLITVRFHVKGDHYQHGGRVNSVSKSGKDMTWSCDNKEHHTYQDHHLKFVSDGWVEVDKDNKIQKKSQYRCNFYITIGVSKPCFEDLDIHY